MASDGRPFGTIEGDGPPLAIPAPQSFRTRELLVGSAERYDCVLRPARAGRSVVRVEHLDWITGEIAGVAETTITVAGEAQRPLQPDVGAGSSPPSARPADPAAGSQTPGPASGHAGHGVAPVGPPSNARRRRRLPLKRRAPRKRSTAAPGKPRARRRRKR